MCSVTGVPDLTLCFKSRTRRSQVPPTPGIGPKDPLYSRTRDSPSSPARRRLKVDPPRRSVRPGPVPSVTSAGGGVGWVEHKSFRRQVASTTTTVRHQDLQFSQVTRTSLRNKHLWSRPEVPSDPSTRDPSRTVAHEDDEGDDSSTLRSPTNPDQEQTCTQTTSGVHPTPTPSPPSGRYDVSTLSPALQTPER